VRRSVFDEIGPKTLQCWRKAAEQYDNTIYLALSLGRDDLANVAEQRRDACYDEIDALKLRGAE